MRRLRRPALCSTRTSTQRMGTECAGSAGLCCAAHAQAPSAWTQNAQAPQACAVQQAHKHPAHGHRTRRLGRPALCGTRTSTHRMGTEAVRCTCEPRTERAGSAPCAVQRAPGGCSHRSFAAHTEALLLCMLHKERRQAAALHGVCCACWSASTGPCFLVCVN